MALADLLDRLEKEGVTPVTAAPSGGVTARAAKTGACTLASPATSRADDSKVGTEFFSGWLLHFADGSLFEVWFSPVVDCSGALAPYPAAVTATPISTDVSRDKALQVGTTQSPWRRCSNCLQLRRPGYAQGYCSGREHTLRHDTEPGTAWWQRAMVKLFAALPIEWLL